MIPASVESPSFLAALRDLHAVEVAVAWRLPAIFRAVELVGLASPLLAWTGGASGRAGRLRATGAAVNGPASSWMGGLVDDAERLTQDLPPGAMLDWSLALAARRMLACVTLGYDALLPLASGSMAAALAANAAEHQVAAQALATLPCPADQIV